MEIGQGLSAKGRNKRPQQKGPPINQSLMLRPDTPRRIITRFQPDGGLKICSCLAGENVDHLMTGLGMACLGLHR